jgi:hypothetical protein
MLPCNVKSKKRRACVRPLAIFLAILAMALSTVSSLARAEGDRGVLLNLGACSVIWFTDTSAVPCEPTGTDKDDGYVVTVQNPTLEDGIQLAGDSLLTVPPKKQNSVIQGAFQLPEIQSGDRFVASVGCLFGGFSCNVVYYLYAYYVGSGEWETIWKASEKYDGLTHAVSVRLGRFAGRRDVIFVLSVFANGNADGDFPIWANPRIERDVPPAPTAMPTSITPRDLARLVQDFPVPNEDKLFPGQRYTKVWWLENVGENEWTTGYKVLFVQGNLPAVSFPFAKNVSPGQTMELQLNLMAPAKPGPYVGHWILQNSDGQQFDIGTSGTETLEAQIAVLDVHQVETMLDFVATIGDSLWMSGIGALSYPGTEDNARYVRRVSTPTLTDGTVDDREALLVSLDALGWGWLQGYFPPIDVAAGDRFQTTISCQYQANNCDATFRLDYRVGDGPIASIWLSRVFSTDTTFRNIDVDLGALAGQKVQFVLSMTSNIPDTSGNLILWIAPRVVRAAPSAETDNEINTSGSDNNG